MKSLLSVALVLLLVNAVWAADQPGAEPGFVSLFDGQTFAGWQVARMPSPSRSATA